MGWVLLVPLCIREPDPWVRFVTELLPITAAHIDISSINWLLPHTKTKTDIKKQLPFPPEPLWILTTLQFRISTIWRQYFRQSKLWRKLDHLGSGYLPAFVTRGRFLFIRAGLPAVIVAVTVTATLGNGYGTDQSCWITTENHVIWAFVAPAMAIIMVWSLSWLVWYGDLNFWCLWYGVVNEFAGVWCGMVIELAGVWYGMLN